MSFLNKKVILYTCLIALGSMSCSTHAKKVNVVTETNDSGQSDFQMIYIPDSLKEPKDRANYLVEHYWDKYNFEDSISEDNSEEFEQVLVDYIDILTIADRDVAELSLNKTYKRAEVKPETLNRFLKHFEKYLYDPNSPLKNEEFYIVILENTLDSDKVDEVERAKAKFALDVLLKNREGELANDLTVNLGLGEQISLYDLDKDYTLLLFYNPDCHACEIITGYMKQSQYLAKALDAKILDIMAVYPDDNQERWEQYSSNIPSLWINGYDSNNDVMGKRLYELRAMPTIYLLDKDKKIVQKDVNIEDVERYLVNNNSLIFEEL